jgi:hypothetical protein
VLPPRRLVRGLISARRALHRLGDSLVPAQLTMFEMSTGHARTMALHVAARLDLASQLAAHGPLDAAALGERCAAHAPTLERLLCLLAAHGVFRRLPDGRFANTAKSELLRRDSPVGLRAWADYMGMASSMGAWAGLERAIRSGEAAFEHVHGRTCWEHFAEVPEEGAVFAEAMGSVTAVDAPAVAAALPVEGIGSLCDVAGGRGTLLAAVLERHAGLRGELFDAPEVLLHARPYLAGRGLLARVELRPGSFFDTVPRGADAFCLKDILHDWDDARCATILGNVRRAARRGARLFVVELIVEPHEIEPESRFADLQMLVVCAGGRQRSRADFERMFGENGFRLKDLRPTPFFPTVLVAEAV